jgi:hypothetical protein
MNLQGQLLLRQIHRLLVCYTTFWLRPAEYSESRVGFSDCESGYK